MVQYSCMKEVDDIVSKFDKLFGKGAIRYFNESADEDVDVISTGCASLDEALGVGGVPRGRIVEIFGPESAGKSTLSLHIAAEAQKQGLIVAYIDAEHAFDPTYATKLGINLDDMLISQPESGDQALELTENLTRTGKIGLIIIDSVAALVPAAELNAEMGDAVVGLMARLMSQAMRKLVGVTSNTNTCIIFINQLRHKIGVMWGSPEVTTGGQALKFYASIRMDIRRVGQLKDGDKIYGNRTKVKVIKNKLATPYKEAEFDLLFGEGISKENDLLESAIKNNIIEQKGSWFNFGEEKLGQGKDNIRKRLKDEPNFYTSVKEKLDDLHRHASETN